MRINRICSEIGTRDIRLEELKEMLLDREYTPKVIDSAIARAKAISRQQALRRVPGPQPITNRPVFVVLFDPRLPSVPRITKKHWRSMVGEENYLKSVFPEPPLVAYKRQTNIKETLIRAKLPAESERPHRVQKGLRKCGKCLACSYIQEGKSVKGKDYSGNKFTWTIGREVSCSSINIVYLLQCDKENCRKQYFNLPGHSSHNMKFTILENVKSEDPLYRREREKLLMRKFNSFYGGINKEP
jgi:hypothetical protein